MSTDDPAGISGHASAVRRFADALLRSGGDNQVTIRISDASTGDTSSQLGLEPPTDEDLLVSPGLIKSLEPASNGNRRIEAVVSANSLQSIAEQYGIRDIVAWLRTAQGILYYEHLMRIETVTVEKYLGADCLYHLTATE